MTMEMLALENGEAERRILHAVRAKRSMKAQPAAAIGDNSGRSRPARAPDRDLAALRSAVPRFRVGLSPFVPLSQGQSGELPRVERRPGRERVIARPAD